MPPNVITDDLPKPPPVSQPFSPDTPGRGQKRPMLPPPAVAPSNAECETPSRRVSARRAPRADGASSSSPFSPPTPVPFVASPAAAASTADNKDAKNRTSPPPDAVRSELSEASPTSLRTPTATTSSSSSAAGSGGSGATAASAASLISPDQRKIWMRPCNDCGAMLHVRRTKCTDCGAVQTSKRTMLQEQEEKVRAEQRAREEAALAQLREAQKEEAHSAASQLAMIFEHSASCQSTPAGLPSPNPFKAGSLPPMAPSPMAPSPAAAAAGSSTPGGGAAAAAEGGVPSRGPRAAQPWAHLSPERLLKLRRLHKLRALLQNLPPGVTLEHNPALDGAPSAGSPRRSARAPAAADAASPLASPAASSPAAAATASSPEADAIAMLASVACM